MVRLAGMANEREREREHGEKRGFPPWTSAPWCRPAAQRRYCPLHHLHMQGVEETPTPEDSSLSVASLIAELDILQYRDAFA